ncbi:MAG TPA: replication-associated recombination protein A, partial [Isosphaeraceae bacterium]|nr:replication-associated recombination protein A [Isosphaeraceae bacterium]
MAGQETRSLFGAPDERPDEAGPDAPLAERMRPRTLEEFIGQGHLVGEGRLVRRLVEGGGPLPSLVLWG